MKREWKELKNEIQHCLWWLHMKRCLRRLRYY